MIEYITEYMEYMVLSIWHWQCQCPQHRLPRTASHNHISQALSGGIQRKVAKTWRFKVELAMEDTGLKCSDLYRHWQPDSLAYDDKLKILYLLEFTRCADSQEDSLLETLEDTKVKYDELL